MDTFTRMVRFTAAIGAASGDMSFLLSILFFRELLESCQSLAPKMSKMVAQQRDALGIQFVNAAGAVATVAHQASLLQYTEVLRDRGTRNRQSGSQLVHRARMGAQHIEDGQAGGIAQSGEAIFYVSIHLR
jgi:hypothetical protein